MESTSVLGWLRDFLQHQWLHAASSVHRFFFFFTLVDPDSKRCCQPKLPANLPLHDPAVVSRAALAKVPIIFTEHFDQGSGAPSGQPLAPGMNGSSRRTRKSPGPAVLTVALENN